MRLSWVYQATSIWQRWGSRIQVLMDVCIYMYAKKKEKRKKIELQRSVGVQVDDRLRYRSLLQKRPIKEIIF